MAQQNSQSAKHLGLGSKCYCNDTTVVPKTARYTNHHTSVEIGKGSQCTRNFKTVFELGSFGWGLTFTKDVLEELRFQYWEQLSRTVSIWRARKWNAFTSRHSSTYNYPPGSTPFHTLYYQSGRKRGGLWMDRFQSGHSKCPAPSERMSYARASSHIPREGKWILIALYTQEQGAKARHEQHKSLFVPRGNLTRIKIDVLPLEAAPYISLILFPNRSKSRVVLNSWLCIKSCCKVQINANWIRRLHCPVR